jgi:hypothetical protein
MKEEREGQVWRLLDFGLVQMVVPFPENGKNQGRNMCEKKFSLGSPEFKKSKRKVQLDS